jgi:hypothetical protein
MIWWAVLGYVLLSPVLGLVVGAAIHMQDDTPASSRPEKSRAVEPCPTRATARVGGRMTIAAGS